MSIIYRKLYSSFPEPFKKAVVIEYEYERQHDSLLSFISSYLIGKSVHDAADHYNLSGKAVGTSENISHCSKAGLELAWSSYTLHTKITML